MPIDEYYDFKYGKLEYRSIKFHNINFPSPKLLPAVTVNFTNNSKFTRMTEWKNLPNHGVNDDYTTITYEEPCSSSENNNEKYYPVKDLKGINRNLYNKYKDIQNKKVQFIEHHKVEVPSTLQHYKKVKHILPPTTLRQAEVDSGT